ncbi:KTSC domain-containing protein [Modicisalibacter luteus]|uniref:KTSC domain-containing protein n=1 Tax=Modicisalibacter luteus TaxID=453962 RepID=A0ABV7M0Y0_9GAMM|nr:KTSC domain-containing protein [Halomonas lutea]GHA94135.1 hypothetical protein GCM10007159_14810 [Halomonas lutea]
MTEWVFVTSTAIAAIGYERETRRLFIDFHDSTPTYTFCDVPEAVYRTFVKAPSVGRFYHRYIRDKYLCEEGP